ncbi:eukaryotic translation initiation factor 3 subunit E [Batrachochytrium salamandrivorans]|nr:eukaryotic translation initiation factor 3 subunit E [Batrachochytrium salamandrivorans]
MVDFSNAIYKELNGTKKNQPGHDQRRESVLATLINLQERVEPVLEIISDPYVVQQLKQDKVANMNLLQEKYKFKPEMLDTLYKYALAQYDMGQYAAASESLYHFKALSINHDKNISALWGKLAADILARNWDGAYDELMSLRESIDQSTFLAADNTTSVSGNHAQLQQRIWLLHWSLFVFFNHARGKDGLIDLFFPAAIPQRHPGLMSMAIAKLLDCEHVLDNDFFLVGCVGEFREAARLFVFEMYCRIHQHIDIKALCEKLNMDQSDGEKWIVNLIRDARMQAKIDSETNTVIMGVQYQSVHQQVMERTKALTFRSSLLAFNIEKRENELHQRRLGHAPNTGGSGSGGRKSKK